MAALHSLSEELVLEVLSYLENDKQALLSLAISSRHLYRLSRPYFYKSVDLDIGGQAFERFAQVIKTDKTLPPLVRNLSLSNVNFSSEDRKNEVAIEAPQTLLSRLYRLETLNVTAQLDCMRPIDEKFSLGPVSPECHRSLTVRPSSTVCELLCLIHQYRPHVLTIVHMPFRYRISPPNPTAGYLSAFRPTPLESLNVKGYFCLRTQPLSCLLKFTPTLRTLECAAFKLGLLADQSPVQLRKLPEAIGPLEPFSISHALRFVATSLEELKLQTAGIPWRSHDGSRLDLSTFDKLKHLDLASNLLFDSPEASSKREGTYALLPSALEKLIINFDFGNYVLAPPARTSHERIDPSEYVWLSEIAAHKAERFASLHHVSLIEISKASEAHRIPCEICAFPRDLKHALETAGIELSTRRRVEDHGDDSDAWVLHHRSMT